MRRVLGLCASIGLILTGLPIVSAYAGEPDAATQAMMTHDVKGGADSPLIGRYEGSTLLGKTYKAFDEYSFAAGASEGSRYTDAKKYSKVSTAQGAVTRLLYLAPTGRSTLEVFTNYADALKGRGFQPVFACANEACGEAFTTLQYDTTRTVTAPAYEQTRNYLIGAAMQQVEAPRYGLFSHTEQGGETLIGVYVGQNHEGSSGNFSDALNGRVLTRIDILQPRAMEARIVTVSAAEMSDEIATNGRAAFYGIYFDFDKADTKPASDAQLAEMAKYIRAHAGKHYYITGHTDDVGGLAYNTGLSQHRAESVAHALAARFGVDAKAVTARGLASLAPLASNATEAGRAKNRRVELVGE